MEKQETSYFTKYNIQPIWIQTVDFKKQKQAIIDNNDLKAKIFAVKDTSHDSKDLVAKLKPLAKNDMEKAFVVFYWISQNIAYNTQGFFSGQYGDNSANGVLKSKVSVCAGYATLFRDLVKELGLECDLVTGFAKGYGYTIGQEMTKPNHEWNIVKINENWCLVENTWGSGFLNGANYVKEFEPFYFLTPAEQFVWRHFPLDSKHQLLKVPLGVKQYEVSINFGPIFFLNGLSLISPQEATLKVDNKLQIKLNSNQDVLMLAHVYFKDAQTKNDTFVQKNRENITIDCVFHNKGDNKVKVFVKKASDPGQYWEFMELKVNVTGTIDKNVGFPLAYSKFLENHCYLYSPIKKTINGFEKWKMDIPGASALMIRDTNQGSLNMKKNKDGIWEGEGKLSGSVSVYGLYNTGGSYDGLLKYD